MRAVKARIGSQIATTVTTTTTSSERTKSDGKPLAKDMLTWAFRDVPGRPTRARKPIFPSGAVRRGAIRTAGTGNQCDFKKVSSHVIAGRIVPLLVIRPVFGSQVAPSM
jgi:hypothetical protein